MLKISKLLDYLDAYDNIKTTKQELPEETLLPFKILAWKKLSEQGLLPEEHSFFDFLIKKGDKENFFNTVNFIGKDESLKKYRVFFPDDVKFLKKYSDTDLIAYINRTNLLEKYPDFEDFYNSIYNPSNIGLLRGAFIDLILNLIGLQETENIYNPYPDDYRLAVRINSKLNKEVYIEDEQITSLPYILNVLFDINLHIEFSNPIMNPSYKEGYTLHLFDTVVSFLPVIRKFEQRLEKDFYIRLQKDIYNRFNYFDIDRAEYTTVCILHILSQTKNRAFVVVPANFLNRNLKAEIDFRKFLLDRNIIDTVILFPNSVSQRSTISYALIVFDKNKVTNDVFFIDASGLITESDYRKENIIIEQEKIIEIFRDRPPDTGFSRVASFEEIKNNVYSLHPKNYIEIKNLKEIFKNLSLTKLSSYGEIISSPVIKRREGTFQVYELQPTDINEFGLVENPKNKKGVFLTESEIEKTEIRNYDILLVSKGTKESLGKIGLVINKPENETWIAGQSIITIRAKSNLFAKALFMFLKTESAMTMLNSLAIGDILLNISAKSLRDMKIPEIKEKKAEKMESLFYQYIKSYEEIKSLKEEMSSVAERTIKIIKEELNDNQTN
ncbi:MAG: N-6 DNA methylase [Proteobacteria bacterium]|nr:N-6 DNA methylase [Pseudomonadota bacterium]